ncbi:MAG: ATP-binding cassette domain-containing protein [Deltaproteobacteria bacterium]|jgi:D-methionine transport system ATP-binding protein|nr:ATP-binding cassette domain-containing protein [Deltaproteobacteria bacterium]
MSFINIKSLTKYFGSGEERQCVLKGIDLSIEEGEIYGVIGLSGAGKSTLIRCLNRLETPDEGEINIAGQDILSLSQEELRYARMEMGMIFQSFNLLSSRTVSGNIAFPLEVKGLPKKLIRERVEELTNLVGLTDKLSSYPSQLSGGQMQRVGIARALANNPKILLSDEATSALDPQTTMSILELVNRLQRRLKLTVVLITHEMKVITEICDRVAVLDGGVIVEEGPVVEVFTNPKNPATQSFVEVILRRDSPFLDNGYSPRGRLLRLRYTGQAVTDPILSEAISQTGVSLVILQAQVDHIKLVPFGTMLVDMAGSEEQVLKAVDYLKDHGVRVEAPS